VYVDDKGVRAKLRNVCNPLDLGQMSETHFVLDAHWKNHFNRQLALSGQPHPTVADLRRWTDLPDERGLSRDVQNLLVLVYADQTNRSFHDHGTVAYQPALDDTPDTLVLREESLPDLKDWHEAVTRVAELFGHAVSKLLNASNLAAFAARVRESVTEHKGDCDGLPDRLHLVLKNLGVPETEAAKCDRVRTAKAVKALLAACEGREPPALVTAVARAKLETNGTAMGKSLKSAKSLADCLRTTRWDLFAAVAQIQDHRRTDAELLLRDVTGWLQADEHALAGGLGEKLTGAEGRAIKLLTPPKAVEPDPKLPPVDPPKPRPGWKAVGSGGKARMGNAEAIAEAKAILARLEQNPTLRLTIQWTLEEESP
jgi:hypothetical protein